MAKHIRVSTVAKILGYSKNHTYRLIREGKLKEEVVAGYKLVSLEDVTALLAEKLERGRIEN